MGSDFSIFLWDGSKMTYDYYSKLGVNPMDTKGPRMCSDFSLQLLMEGERGTLHCACIKNQ